ncbi:MAG: RnfABCDGE type electron transport complex subunit B [Gammaproteobacteria bacterium]|nr:RnfABCDGE type electron transport complex subunit B [Gammaproteobacteria bacterium]
MSRRITPETIDTILPQTQCGLCGYGGCMPYANALVRENAAINLCPPGGVKGLKAIADLLQEDATPFIAEMEKNAKPKLLAIIREAECIGCTKCIQACPVDAILGSAKNMHTIIADECTGCELCVAPCPVDCIDMIAIPDVSLNEEKQKADIARKRFQARSTRLEHEEKDPVLKVRSITRKNDSAEDKKSYIQEAILRAKMKKSQI